MIVELIFRFLVQQADQTETASTADGTALAAGKPKRGEFACNQLIGKPSIPPMPQLIIAFACPLIQFEPPIKQAKAQPSRAVSGTQNGLFVTIAVGLQRSIAVDRFEVISRHVAFGKSPQSLDRLPIRSDFATADARHRCPRFANGFSHLIIGQVPASHVGGKVHC
jgi:hypothetical protein